MLLSTIKKIFREKASSIRYWLIAIKYSLNSLIKLPHIFILYIPRKDYWIAKSKRFILYYPKEGLYPPNSNIFRKYSYKNLVKVEKDDIVCDIGAFIGEFTRSIADIASKIILVEPDPQNFRFLRRNTIHIKNLTFIRNPLWKENQYVNFKLGGHSTDSSIVDPYVKRGVISVKAKRLDSLFQELKLERIDFLKMDTEGANPEVLEGSEGILSKIKKIAIDCSPERYGKTTIEEVTRILRKAGFIIYIKKNYVVCGYRI